MYHHYAHSCAPGLDGLWVVAVVSNPLRWRSRYDRFRNFEEGCRRVGANLLIVELALGDRPFELTRHGHPHHIQLRSFDEIWHKESLINLGIERLPPDWQYVAWIDADIEFVRHDWPSEIVHQLQHHMVIQLFENMIDLGPNGETVSVQHGFVSEWLKGKQLPGYSWNEGGVVRHKEGNYGKARWHPGYAWAARREAIDALGGLIDKAILGSADHHMAFALIGKVFEYAPDHMSPGYHRMLETWQDRATRHIQQDIGFMPGTAIHHWHGRKADRNYVERWDVLLKHNYDPDYDLKRDWQGLNSFTAQGERMRNDIRRYFRNRLEDATDFGITK